MFVPQICIRILATMNTTVEPIGVVNLCLFVLVWPFCTEPIEEEDVVSTKGSNASYDEEEEVCNNHVHHTTHSPLFLYRA